MRILLVVYDNDSYISVFPLGIAYLAAVARDRGHEVEIYNQDVYHWPDGHLTKQLDLGSYDLVGIGVIGGYYQYRKLLRLAEAVNHSRKRPFFVVGGHGPSPEPEYFLNKTGADVVVVGEGEDTFLDLLDAVSCKKSLHGVQGIAYFESGKFFKTARRPLIQNIDSIPFPAWEKFPMDHYALLREPNSRNSDRCMLVITGRGCNFTCNFCYRLDQGRRERSVESVVEEILKLKLDYGINYIDFQDELFMSSEARSVELASAFQKRNLNIRWFCNGRLNFAKPDVLRVMKEAGCVFINYGIECLDDRILKIMGKGLTQKLIVDGIQNTLEAGISPGFNVIFGNIGETRETLKKGVEFLLKYDDHAQMRTIRPVTPYPGSPLYDYAIERGLLKDCEDFYERKHLNSDLLSVNFTDLSEEEFHKSLLEANSLLIERYFEFQKQRALKNAEKLYLHKDSTFRGFRQT